MMGGLKQKFLTWWSQRPEREQKIMVVAVILIVVSGFYKFGYQPLSDNYATALNEFQKASGDYRWIKERVRELDGMTVGVMPQQETTEMKRKSIEKYLAEHNIQGTVERVDQRGKTYIETRLSNVKGVSMMRWIDTLMKNGYPISSFRIENEKGKVTGRVIVQVK